jgi:putative transcriptional regulator
MPNGKLENLIKIRKSMGFRVSDMAANLNISPSYYCQIELGHRRLYYDMAKKIAHVFKLKPDDIFY